MFRLRCGDPSTSNDPRQAQERKVMLLGECLAEKPTLPWHCQNATDRLEAYDLPRAHCSFKECSFSADNDAAILEHILEAHKPTLTEAAGEEASVEAMVSLYCAALTWKCQGGAPVANASIDRRALQQFQKAREGDEIVALLCFVCARKYPYIRSGRNQEVTWAQPVHGKDKTVFGQSPEEAEKLLGMEPFMQRYVAHETVFAQQEMKHELQDWACEVQMGNASVRLLCCPEDKVCAKRCNEQTLCPQCWVPLCRSCKQDLVWHKKLPAAALSNDMMVYYGPKDACRKEVTVMEMVCASPCLTTMICFSLEQKLRGDRALDQDAWMNRHRMAARGNATTFPLAWEDLLQQLQAATWEVGRRKESLRCRQGRLA